MQAKYYHMHHMLYEEDIPYWGKLIQDAANHECLELGCGTGRVMKLVQELGLIPEECHITGVDQDHEMLAVAKEVLGISNQFSFIEENILSMNLAKQYSLIYFPCNTYSVFSIDEQKQLLRSIIKNLTLHGCFAFSQPNPVVFETLAKISEAETELVLQNDENENPVMVSSEWIRQEGFFALTWHYDELFSNGEVKRTSLTTRHYLTSVESILQTLDVEGFKIKNIFGDFDRSPYSKDSDNLIIEAIR